jgi:dienelactone hydrolase
MRGARIYTLPAMANADSLRHLTSLHRFSELHVRESRSMGFTATTREEHAQWKRDLRVRLAGLTGLDRMEMIPPETFVRGSFKEDGYTREEILLKTEPDVWMPVSVLVPDDVKKGERRPAVIAAHGHMSTGRMAVTGRADVRGVRELIARYNYDYGVRFARAGLVAFCPDARGMGERREGVRPEDLDAPDPCCTCAAVNHMATGLGRTLTGLWTWDHMRLLDYIGTRGDCDASRIAGAGFSSGGQQILWLSAMDDRVSRAVVSGYFYGYRDSLLALPGNCSCNYVARLWESVDMGDLGALIAPRPLLAETGDKDDLNGARGAANAVEQVSIARGAYALYGRPDLPRHVVFDGGHRWRGVEALEHLLEMRAS